MRYTSLLPLRELPSCFMMWSAPQGPCPFGGWLRSCSRTFAGRRAPSPRTPQPHLPLFKIPAANAYFTPKHHLQESSETRGKPLISPPSRRGVALEFVPELCLRDTDRAAPGSQNGSWRLVHAERKHHAKRASARSRRLGISMARAGSGRSAQTPQNGHRISHPV